MFHLLFLQPVGLAGSTVDTRLETALVPQAVSTGGAVVLTITVSIGRRHYHTDDIHSMRITVKNVVCNVNLYLL